MPLQYETYSFSSVLGWSISRHETFDKCKRQYFYNYYSKYVPDVPQYKLTQLKNLTSVPLEVGNVVHEVLEAFLHRLQKNASDINEQRFFDFARQKTESCFASKTFLETLYRPDTPVDIEKAHARVSTCMRNFINSPCYSWIFMKALINKNDWMIEPGGYGETRLGGIKAYCKMDFLFPVDGEIHILDWKTGAKDQGKHGTQLTAYAMAASHNFNIPIEKIYPKIIYLYPEFSEFEISLGPDDFETLLTRAKNQTIEMQAFCKDPDKNIPLSMDNFPCTAFGGLCSYCNYQGICDGYKDKKAKALEDKGF